MHLFIEICRPKTSWLSLNKSAREDFLQPVGALMRRLESEGTEIIAWGFNDEDTPHRAKYDFFAALKFPNIEDAERYEKTFAAAGWYNYFEQINVLGEMESYSETLARLSNLCR